MIIFDGFPRQVTQDKDTVEMVKSAFSAFVFCTVISDFLFGVLQFPRRLFN